MITLHVDCVMVLGQQTVPNTNKHLLLLTAKLNTAKIEKVLLLVVRVIASFVSGLVLSRVPRIVEVVVFPYWLMFHLNKVQYTVGLKISNLTTMLNIKLNV